MSKNKNNTICIIPARQNSKRIKNKNLLKINGKTLTEISIVLAKKSKLFKEIILSSDSKKIINLGKKLKIMAIKRDKALSQDNTTTDDVIKNLISNINFEYENIILLQVTSPLRKISTLKKFYSHCLNKKLSSCLSVSLINDNLSKKDNFFNSVNDNIRNSQNRKPFIYENGLLYFFKKKEFLKKNKIYPKKNWPYFITDKYESLDINELQDYKIAKKIYN